MGCRITDYDLVQALTIDDLQVAVRARLPQGWQPLGSVTSAYDANGTVLFLQTIVVVVWDTGDEPDSNGGKPARLPIRPKTGTGRGMGHKPIVD